MSRLLPAFFNLFIYLIFFCHLQIIHVEDICAKMLS